MIGRNVTFMAFAAVALAACHHSVVPNYDQLELHRSSAQALVLLNGGDSPLLVQPQGDGDGPLTIPAGGTVRIGFEVLSVIEIEVPEGGTRFQTVEGTARNIVENTAPAGYLSQTDIDATLRVGEADALPEKRRFALAGCPGGGWEAGPAGGRDHSFDLAVPPLPGIPWRLCP